MLKLLLLPTFLSANAPLPPTVTSSLPTLLASATVALLAEVLPS